MLCPKIGFDQHTPLNNFNTHLKLNTQIIGVQFELLNKIVYKIKNGL